MTPPWIVGTYVRATPQNSCESLGIAIYQSMLNGECTGIGFVLLNRAS